MRKIAEIRVGKRIRKIHRVSLCHDFENLFTKESDKPGFIAHGMIGLQKLVNLENKYLRLKNGQRILVEDSKSSVEESSRSSLF